MKNKKDHILLTVVMPAYNEEEGIERAVREVRHFVLDRVEDAELVVIDDGSTDSTGVILDRWTAQEPRLRVIHQTNKGHGGALRTGFDLAQGTYLFVLDSDRQIPLEAFDAAWRAALERDGILGVRRRRHDARIRLVLSAVVRRLVGLLFGVQLSDANAPFKVFRRSIWLQARALIPEETLTPSLFLAIYMRWGGWDVAERAVPHRQRTTGAVSLQRWKLIRFCLKAFKQLLRFRKALAAAGLAQPLALDVDSHSSAWRAKS